MYVDDALVGVHTVSQGLKAKEELIKILESGGFELLKGLAREKLLNEDFWSSATKALLSVERLAIKPHTLLSWKNFVSTSVGIEEISIPSFSDSSKSAYAAALYLRVELTLATTRLECWIIRGWNLVKTRYRNCTKCVLAQKKRQTQLMAALPPERTTISRAFSTSGVDFAGPVEIKNFSGRGCRISKGYICLFVCFATEAIHLEPVSDLSTPAFIAALARFVARRGCPRHIYSDNGKNFVGAGREIRSNLMKIISETRDDSVTRYGFQKLEWHFNPAAAPHMGGL
ncbi:uncharacterized protein LOC131804368 [Musca domestica]|uniref:Uncharacterized protein LOC131804368 n=1 Tax=Musca domestica TaxID=7370 RepID=A0ABM3VBY9_MUSDO|nr:uncharacterized protein LOC131804368 [Musca domestica]